MPSFSCKICNSPSPFFDRCDFHANAKLHFGFHDADIQPSGMMLDYHRCPSCGFMFTPFMDAWGDNEYRHYVYNQDYARIDGTFNGYRAGLFANIFTLAFHDHLKDLSFLDYGGGIGLQAIMLKAFGAKRSETYDPFAANKARPEGTFNIVSCIEVFEHSSNPKATFDELVSFMAPDNSILFITTELQPDDIEAKKCNWWYCNPRVGHISFSTKQSMQLLAAPYGLKLAHIGLQATIAYKTWPIWADKLLAPENQIK